MVHTNINRTNVPLYQWIWKIRMKFKYTCTVSISAHIQWPHLTTITINKSHNILVYAYLCTCIPPPISIFISKPTCNALQCPNGQHGFCLRALFYKILSHVFDLVLLVFLHVWGQNPKPHLMYVRACASHKIDVFYFTWIFLFKTILKVSHIWHDIHWISFKEE